MLFTGDSVLNLPAGKESAMVPKWYPTLRKYVIRSLDTILWDFEKTPISYRFTELPYEKFRRLLPDYSDIGQ